VSDLRSAPSAIRLLSSVSSGCCHLFVAFLTDVAPRSPLSNCCDEESRVKWWMSSGLLFLAVAAGQADAVSGQTPSEAHRDPEVTSLFALSTVTSHLPASCLLSLCSYVCVLFGTVSFTPRLRVCSKRMIRSFTAATALDKRPCMSVGSAIAQATTTILLRTRALVSDSHFERSCSPLTVLCAGSAYARWRPVRVWYR
jgi:hypothetical protein